MDISKIKKAPYNPRRMGKASKEALKKSLETFEDISGITVNKRSGNVVAGLIFYLVDISLWLLSIILGLSILFWMISFTTKILLFPTKKLQDENQA